MGAGRGEGLRFETLLLRPARGNRSAAQESQAAPRQAASIWPAPGSRGTMSASPRALTHALGGSQHFTQNVLG